MATLNLQVGASADDAYSYDGNIDLLFPYILMGDFAGEDATRAGYRFTGVSGLSGATINNAVLTFRAFQSDVGTNLIGDWYAHDVEAPATFSTGADINGRALTTATVEGDGVDFGAWVAGQDHTFSTDGTNYIKDIIQELADSYDPSAIAMLWVKASGNHERLPRSWDFDTGLAAKLDIDYTAAGIGADEMMAAIGGGGGGGGGGSGDIMAHSREPPKVVAY